MSPMTPQFSAETRRGVTGGASCQARLLVWVLWERVPAITGPAPMTAPTVVALELVTPVWAA
jgi:hypothetical protein